MSFWVEVNLCSFFIIYFYLYCHWRLSYQEGRPRFGIPLTCLTLPHFCACPKPGPGFPTSYVMVFFVLSELRWEAIVCVVDIGGIGDHRCFYFLLINATKTPIKKPADLVGNTIKCSQNSPIYKSANLVWHTIQSNAAKTLQFTNQQSWLAHCSQLQPILSNPQTSRLAWHTIKAKTLQFTNQQTWLAYYAVKWAKTFQFTNQPSWLACYSQMQPKLFNSQTSEFGQHTIQPKLSNSQISKLGWHTIESNAAKTPQFTNQQSWLAYYKVKWVKTLQFANQQTWSAN